MQEFRTPRVEFLLARSRPALHPDDTEVRRAEARRRYEAGEIEAGGYYPADAVRRLILHLRNAPRTDP